MSGLKRIFGSSINKKNVTQDTAAQALAEAEETLLKRQAFLEKKIEIEVQKAKKFAKEKNKRGMFVTLYLLLSRSRMFEEKANLY